MVAIIIVPQSLRSAAEQCVATLSPSSVGDALTIPLMPIDKPESEPTHWASTPNVSGGALKLIQALVASERFPGCTLATCDPEECLPIFRRTIEALRLTRQIPAALE